MKSEPLAYAYARTQRTPTPARELNSLTDVFELNFLIELQFNSARTYPCVRVPAYVYVRSDPRRGFQPSKPLS